MSIKPAEFLKNILIKVATACARAFCAVPIIRKLYLLVSARHRPVTAVKNGAHTFLFFTPTFTPYWRAMTLFTKEPETIKWIDGFSPDDVLYDIGANVGTYTVYAAVTGKTKAVLAFEPESQNFALLNENVYLNDLQDKVTCINIALSNVNKLDFLYLSEFTPGMAIHSFGKPINHLRRPTKSAFKQGVISFTLDRFIEMYNPEFPSHIKIDVDGLEKEIIEGARNTLSDRRLKSLLVEINEELKEDLKLIEDLRALGFDVKYRGHAPMFDTGPFSKVFNYIFVRK
ncbi:MAG: FkbM family methyltransferase [Nitrospirae bacterium]|nr:FkbM family methyltransferase [Nitrospirota bacterium]